jgi:hypothetical protein
LHFRPAALPEHTCKSTGHRIGVGLWLKPSELPCL